MTLLTELPGLAWKIFYRYRLEQLKLIRVKKKIKKVHNVY